MLIFYKLFHRHLGTLAMPLYILLIKQIFFLLHKEFYYLRQTNVHYFGQYSDDKLAIYILDGAEGNQQ